MSNPIPREADVVKEYMANKKHLAGAAQDKKAEQVRSIAEKSFHEFNTHNQKEAKKKKSENEEFSVALDLACILNEIRLRTYFEKMIEKNSEIVKERDEQAYQHFRRVLEDARNPYPISLPQNGQSPQDYQTQVLAEAKGYLAAISARENEIETRMQNNWGAATWQEGLEKQTQALHERLAEKINNHDFLRAIEKTDGNSIDPKQFKPADLEKARDEFHKVNDSLQNFLNERPPPAFIPVEEFNMVRGEAAPVAPAIASDLQFAPDANIIRKSQFEVDSELFLINQARNAYSNIGKPLIEENPVKIDAEATVNKNSSLRLAVNYTTTVNPEIKTLTEKASQFVEDARSLGKLREQKAEIVGKIASLEVKAEFKDSPPRLK